MFVTLRDDVSGIGSLTLGTFWGRIDSKGQVGFWGKGWAAAGPKLSLWLCHYCLFLPPGQLCSMDFLRFDSHNIYYLFKHRQSKYVRGLLYLTKQSHMNSLLIFRFCFKRRRPATGFRCAGMSRVVGPLGRLTWEAVTHWKGLSLPNVHITSLACVRFHSEKGQRGDMSLHHAGF